jgi:hypothetical protein
VQLRAALLLVYKASSHFVKTKTVSMDASIAKLFVNESLVSAARDTVQIHGGYGYMVEYEIERVLHGATRALSIPEPRKCSATSSPGGWGCNHRSSHPSESRRQRVKNLERASRPRGRIKTQVIAWRSGFSSRHIFGSSVYWDPGDARRCRNSAANLFSLRESEPPHRAG